MVLVEIKSVGNNAVLSALQAGEVEVEPQMGLTQTNIDWAWSARKKTKVSTCDTCPGYGIKNIAVDKKVTGYDPLLNRYQALDYIPNSCPGDDIGFAESYNNVSVVLVDSYAGVAYMGGQNIENGGAHIAVVFQNTALDETTNSFIVAYVDFAAFELRMVEVQMQVFNGVVKMCAPNAKFLKPRPDLVDHTNIIEFWNSGDPMNVASCLTCAGFGVTSFQFSVTDSLDPTPLPTAAPLAVPTEVPTISPTLGPTLAPTDLPPGWYLAPDAADGVIDGKQMVVQVPVTSPTAEPIIEPTFAPIPGPTYYPIAQPTLEPSFGPTFSEPTMPPVISNPTLEPTITPITEPTQVPVIPPTMYPVHDPTHEPIINPTPAPTTEPTTKTTIILGRPCDVSDDYTDEGGLTVNGTSLEPPTMEPTFGPTYPPDVPPPPTLAPTFQPTDEPTLGPTYPPDIIPPPTFAPTLPPTDSPTLYSTPYVTYEPCIDTIYSHDGSQLLSNLYALPIHNALQLDAKTLKPCDRFPNFKSAMKLITKLDRNNLSQPIIVTSTKKSVEADIKNPSIALSNNNNEIANPVAKPEVLETVKAPVKKELTPAQQFYLTHFAKLDQEKLAAKQNAAKASLRRI